MITVVYGGSGSGKSSFGENLCEINYIKSKYYLATMLNYGEEAKKKIEKHRIKRKNKNFKTIEKATKIHEINIEKNAIILVECIGNLLSNTMFEDNKGLRAIEEIKKSILDLKNKAQDIIFITNDISKDGGTYEKETRDYILALGKINTFLFELGDVVYQVEAGIGKLVKARNYNEK